MSKEFIEKWSNWFILQKDSAELKEAFQRELNQLITQGVEKEREKYQQALKERDELDALRSKTFEGSTVFNLKQEIETLKSQLQQKEEDMINFAEYITRTNHIGGYNNEGKDWCFMNDNTDELIYPKELYQKFLTHKNK